MIYSQPVHEDPEFLRIKNLPDDTSKVMLLFRYAESITDSTHIESRSMSEYGIELSKSLNMRFAEALFNNLLGISYYNVSEPAYAIDYYLKAKLIYEELLKNAPSDSTIRKNYYRTNNNIAIIYSDFEQYEEAYKYFSFCLDYAKSEKDERMMTIYLNNIGRVLMLRGKLDEARMKLDEAIELCKKNNFKRAKAFAYSNIAELESKLSNYDSSLFYYKKANELYDELGEKYELALNYYEIAKIYLKYRDIKNASHYVSLLSAQTELLEDKYIKKSYLSLNSEIEFLKGDYKKAYELRIKYDAINDSITNSNIEREKKFFNVQMDLHEVENENKRIQAQNEINEAKSTTRNLVFILVIAFLVFVSVIFLMNFKHQKKVNSILKEKYELTEKQNETLNKLIALRNKLFYIISHDLRSPFNTILGFSDILKSNYDNSSKEERISIINNLYEISTNAFNLVENLLYWSKSQQNEIKPVITSFNVLESLKDVIALNKQFAQSKNINIDSDIPDDLEIKSDKEILRILVRNLLNNAIKYSEKDSTVKIKISLNNNCLKCVVRDYGTGLDPEIFHKITNNILIESKIGTQQETGTGFGLMTCYELLKLLNGKLYMSPEIKPGTELIFEIPVKID